MTPPARKPPRYRRRAALWDKSVVRRWQRVRLPGWLHRFLVVFVRAGDGWGWALIALALLFLLPGDRLRPIVGQALLSVAISLPVYWALKLTFRRRRPYALFKRILPRVPPLDAYSFPSGHTMNNLAVAVTLAFHLPWLWPIAVAVPLSLGLLRVLYGVHFLSDIVGGAILGVLSALAAHCLYPHLLL